MVSQATSEKNARPLSEQVLEWNSPLWPTASACVANDGEGPATFYARATRRKAAAKDNGNGNGTPLTVASQVVMERIGINWPTVTVGDSRAAARHTTTTGVMKDGTTLTDAVRAFPLPSLQALPSLTCGPQSLDDAPTSPQQPKRRLNSRFVEWLMGLPAGWTGFAPLETESYPQWRRTHSSVLHTLLGLR